MKKIYVLGLIAWCCTACDLGESPILPVDRGDVKTFQVEMGTDYRTQIFYDLSTLSIVSSNEKEIWDLGFEAAADGFHVVLNTSRGGAVYRTGNPNIEAVTDTLGAQWRRDVPSGHLDSTAIGDQRTAPEVLVIDRGYNAAGNHTGLRKIQVTSISATQYQVQGAKMDGSDAFTLDIPKDGSRNYIAVSLDPGAVVEVEPDKQSWDLMFTQYTHIFTDPPLPYLVVGVRINQANVSVAPVKDREFSELSFDDVDQYTFYTAADVIGYTWKQYEFSTGSFIVFPEYNFLLRDGEGRHFKLHFIDYYNENGDKGAPKLEVQEL